MPVTETVKHCKRKWYYLWLKKVCHTKDYIYTFDTVKTHNFFLVSINYGCENGNEYRWSKIIFGLVETVWSYNVTKRSHKKRLKKVGTCQDK